MILYLDAVGAAVLLPVGAGAASCFGALALLTFVSSGFSSDVSLLISIALLILNPVASWMAALLRISFNSV